MQNLRLLELLESVLGHSKKTSKENHSFYCPFPNCKKHKRKLEINLASNPKGEYKWHCWVCDRKGKYIHNLFRKINVPRSKLDALSSIVKTPYRVQNWNKDSDSYTKELQLPKEYKPLWEPSKNFEYKHALYYVTKTRGLSLEDIYKYRVGYCESGPYKGKIVIPSYDSYGNLNFFTARNYRLESKNPHKNPDVSKDIIGFELFINWSLPIVLVEGAFDAISIKRNVIPLFGKIVLDNLKLKIIEENVQDIYIALDKDALKKAISVAEEFMKEGINVYFVDMSDKDPNEMGFEKMTELIHNTSRMKLSDLLKLKMSMKRK